MDVLAATNVIWLREQMALSLGYHIVLSCIGIGFPIMVLIAEWRYLRTGDELWRTIALRWSKALGVLFAVGAVSGTILSFEFGILWPPFMAQWGDVFGLAFALEGVMFFTEAVFLAIYLYSWDHFSPRKHFLVGLPVAISGLGAAFFIISVNAWMNNPTGFTLDADGSVTDVDPIAALFTNSHLWWELLHMVLAALIVAGFGVATVYAWRLLKGRAGPYHRRAFFLAFSFGAVFILPQLIVGDSLAQQMARDQPEKLAAAEALFPTTAGAPETIGGVVVDGELKGGIEIPDLLSLLAFRDPDATVQGLDAFPSDTWPPVNIVHLSFDAMVGAGTALLLLAAWYGWRRWRRPDPLRSRWFLRGAVLAGPLAVLALWTGWIVTEVGRQPWIVYEIMRTSDAASTANGLELFFLAMVAIYALVTVAAVIVLRGLADRPLPPGLDAGGDGTAGTDGGETDDAGGTDVSAATTTAGGDGAEA